MMLAGSIWESALRMPQIAVIMGCMIPIVAIINGSWYKAQKVRAEHDLERMLVERGMSAHEIERIMVAGYHEESETLNNCRWPSVLSVAISTR